MQKHLYFVNEIALISDSGLIDFVEFYLDNYVPYYFWTVGASSSGKFHPAFSQDMGGLVRHTKAVSAFCEELMRMSQWAYMTEDRKNYARIACIVHDTCKYGITDYNKDEYRNHAENAAFNVNNAWREMFDEDAPFELTQAIVSHMGQWSTDKDKRPFTPVDRLVHMADYIASRAFIDIPSISEEWERVNDIEMEEYEAITSELPF